MPPRHIYNYKKRAPRLLGACWAPTPSRDRQQWRTEGLGLTAAFGIAGRLGSDGLRIGGGIFERPVDRFAYRRRYRGRGRRNMGAARVRRWPPGRRATIRWALLVI